MTEKKAIKDIYEQYGNLTTEHQVDTLEKVKEITKDIKKDPIGMLVNNVDYDQILDMIEVKEIEEGFKDVNNFNELAQKITSPINKIVGDAAKVIQDDPIMDVSDNLKEINQRARKVYNKIMRKDEGKGLLYKIPVIGKIIKKTEENVQDLHFQMKDIEEQINIIFEGLNQSENSLKKSITMQIQFLEGLDNTIVKLAAYYKYIKERKETFEKKYREQIKSGDILQQSRYKLFIDQLNNFLMNLMSLINNVQLARNRLNMRLSTAIKLSTTIETTSPILKTLLATSVLETSGQQATESALESLTFMGETVDSMSSDLTDRTIATHKKVEEITSKPVLKTEVFLENVRKLEEHFNSIEEYRNKLAEETKAEKKAMTQALTVLNTVGAASAKDVEYLKDELMKFKK